MKRKDLYAIIAISVVAGIFAIILSNVVIGSPKKHIIKVPVVDPIKDNLASPYSDPAYKAFYNLNALNPTQLIQIGDSPNTKPFNNGQ